MHCNTIWWKWFCFEHESALNYPSLVVRQLCESQSQAIHTYPWCTGATHVRERHWSECTRFVPIIKTACSICASDDRNERGRPKVRVIFGIGCVGNPRNVFYATRHMCRFRVPDGNWLTAHDRCEHTAAWLINERMASVSQWTRFGSLACTTRCQRHTSYELFGNRDAVNAVNMRAISTNGGGIIATVVVVRSGSIVCVCVCCVTLAIVAQSRRRNATCNGFAP